MEGASIQFALKLKELRERAGLSQKELAERAGLSQRAVSHWEQGLRDPSWPNVQALCVALGVSCEEFQSPPLPRESPGPGRPSAKKPEAEEAKPKRPGGRPRKAEG
jgi:transcriptional regulator with XRE-family HTH domain